jgi:hypothetical protein
MENIAGTPGIPEDPNQAQLQLENPGDIAGISIQYRLTYPRQQTVKIVLKIVVPAIPVRPGIFSIPLLLLLSIV